MLPCSSCVKRTLQTLVGDLVTIPSPSTALLSRSRTSRATSPYNKRYYAQLRNTSPYSNSGTATAYEKAIAKKQPDKRQEWLDSRGTRPISKAQNKPAKGAPDTEFVVRKHLQYLKDPVKLADFVRKSLRSDEFDTTLEVVRSASKSLQCIVSWNHLIDYALSQGKMNAAIKIYNEMKKRAQFPEGHTYTILFRGCAEHKDTSHALEKVISIYRTMLLDKSKIKPSTIHVNAVLKMCARAGDMDSMVTIAAEMPDHGPGSPDTLTYTTLLNALRMDAVVTLRDTLTPMQKRSNARKAIISGRYIWQDLTKRWAKGYLWIDEELVCAMGRLLAVGEAQDKDNVFDMIEQTMQIPRQIGALRADNLNPIPIEDADHPQIAAPPANMLSSDGENVGSKFPITFNHVPLESPAPRSGLYAKPGRNTLSLVLMALLNSRRGQGATVKGPATSYWNIITKEYGIIPDRENFLAYLRILRAARSSSETIDLLGSMPLKDMDHSTFRIAISCCQRDKKNHNAFANAGKILDYMQQTMSVPDVSVCESYLDVAVYSEAGGNPSGNRDSTSTGVATAKAAQGKQILRALDRLHPHFTNLRSLLTYGDPAPIKERSSKYNPQDPSIQKGVVGLARRMISAIDILKQQSLVPRTLNSELIEKKAKLMRVVTRYAPKSAGLKSEPPKLATESIAPPSPSTSEIGASSVV